MEKNNRIAHIVLLVWLISAHPSRRIRVSCNWQEHLSRKTPFRVSACLVFSFLWLLRVSILFQPLISLLFQMMISPFPVVLTVGVLLGLIVIIGQGFPTGDCKFHLVSITYLCSVVALSGSVWWLNTSYFRGPFTTCCDTCAIGCSWCV